MPLDKQVISWPLTGGLATKQAPLVQMPGTHLQLENVRQERLNEWRARNGHTRSAADNFPSAHSPVRSVAIDDNGGMLALSREPVATGSNPNAVAAWVYSPSLSTRWTVPVQTAVVFPAAWTRRAVAAFTARPFKTTVASGGPGKFTLVAWENRGSATYGIETYLVSPEGEIRANTHLGSGGGVASQPCASYVASADRLVLVWCDSTTIKVIVWNATTGAVQFGPSTLDATAANATPYVDSVAYATPGFTATVVYRTGANQIRFIEYDPSTGTATTAATIAAACDNCLHLLQDPEASGTRFVAYSDATPAVKVSRANTAGTVSTTDTIDTVAALNIAGVAYEAGASFQVAYTVASTGPLGTATTTIVKAGKKKGGVVTTGAQIMTLGYQVDSGAWRESGADHMRFVAGLHVDADPAGGFSANVTDTQNTFYEKALEFNNGGFNLYDEAQARMLPLGAADLSGAPVHSVLCQPQRLSADTFLISLVRRSRAGLQAGGSAANQYAVDLWTVAYLNETNRTSINQGRGLVTSQASYIPVGNLLQSVSGNVVAHGATALPRQVALSQSAGGSLTANATYGYFTTIEMPDENGNIWRSGPGPVASIALGGGGANKTVTVTALFPDLEVGVRQRTVKIWRTDGNGSTYRLRFVKTDTVANTMSLTLVDTLQDSLTVQNDIWDPAELPTTITPRFSHVELWNRRVWGVDADFPDRLWFSKPLIPGISPEFVATQVMFLDDDKGDITGLDSFDDRLLVFKANATYVVSGDGPDRTGAGAFPFATQIDGDLGVKLGTPTVSTGNDVFFVSSRGIYRCSRALEMDFVGEAVDVFLNQPLVQTPATVMAAVFSPASNEVRFQLVNATGYTRLVYDRLHNLWVKDTADLGGSAVLQSTMIAGRQAFFINDARLLFEGDTTVVEDDINSYQGHIRSAWMRPAGFDGWMRLYRARLMGERTNISQPTAPQLNVFYDGNGAVSVGGGFPINTLQTTPWRAEFRPARQRCSSFMFECILAPDDVTVRLEAWGAVVGIKRGTQPLTINERWM